MHACLNTVCFTDLMAGYLLIVYFKYFSVIMRLTWLRVRLISSDVQPPFSFAMPVHYQKTLQKHTVHG